MLFGNDLLNEKEKARLYAATNTRFTPDIKKDGNLFSLVNNVWKQIYFELFKTILSSAKTYIVEADIPALHDSARCEYNKALIANLFNPAVTKVNEFIGKKMAELVDADGVKEDMKLSEEDEYTKDLNFMDFYPNDSASRITKPSIASLFPRIMISDNASPTDFLRCAEITTQYPFDKLPVINVFPSFQSAFDTKTVPFINNMQNVRNAINDKAGCVEILADSIIYSVLEILPYMSATGELEPDGYKLIEDAVNLYADFTTLCVVINLRKAHISYIGLITKIVDYYKLLIPYHVNYGQDFFLVINEIMRTKAGSYIAYCIAASYCTSTIQFLDINDNDLVNAKEYDNVLGKDFMAKINAYLRSFVYPFSSSYAEIYKKYREELAAYTEFVWDVTTSFFTIALLSTFKGTLSKENIENTIRIEFGKLNKINFTHPYTKKNGKLLDAPYLITITGKLIEALKTDIFSGVESIRAKVGTGVGFFEKSEAARRASASIAQKRKIYISECGQEFAAVSKEVMAEGASVKGAHLIHHVLENAKSVESLIGIQLECISLQKMQANSGIMTENSAAFSNVLYKTIEEIDRELLPYKVGV